MCNNMTSSLNLCSSKAFEVFFEKQGMKKCWNQGHRLNNFRSVCVVCMIASFLGGGAPLYSSTSALSRTGSLNLGVKSFESTQRPSVQQQLQVWEMGNYCPFKIHSLRCLIFNLSSHHRGGQLYCNRLFSGYLTKYQSSTDTGINGHLPDSWETGERLLKLLELLENDTRDHMGFSVLLRW